MSTEIIFANAIAHYQKGQLDEAEKALRHVLEMMPEHSDSYYFLGLIAMQKGANEAAIPYLYEANQGMPENEDYIFSLAVALQETGRLQESMAYYERIGHLAETQNALGNIYRAQGKPIEAMTAFNQALKIDPKFVWAIANKGILLREAGDVKGAFKAFEKAVKMDPRFAEGWHQVALQHRLNGDLHKALPDYERALLLDPKSALIWNGYGVALSMADEDDKAIAAFDHAIALDRFMADAYFNKGLVLEKTGKDADAETSYRDAIRGQKNFAKAYYRLGSLLHRHGRLLEALETYRQVFIINPNHMETCFNLAVVLEDLEEFEEAAGLYFNVLAHQQLQDQVHIRLAALLPKWTMVKPDDADKAITFAKGWVKHFPDHPLARHTFNALTGKADDDVLFGYVQTFYNAFAESYDEKMKELDCQVPSLIKAHLPKTKGLRVLDLGCGTGACAKSLKSIAKELIGVDASAQMIIQAKSTKLYNKLYTQDALDFLTAHKKKFDLIVAADVFCYMSALDGLFAEVARNLKPKGRFIFTVESGKGKDYQINLFGRFLHSKKYIERLLKQNKIALINLEENPLRKEGTSYAKGYIVVGELA